MGSRHFENKARRSFWVVHLEAWRQSGLSRARYCRDHRLNVETFKRWLVHIAGAEEARKHTEYQTELRREERRKCQRRKARQRFSISTDIRNRAVQAFWAMHVEAMNWSGMGVREYAAALQLSPTSLRKWRDRLLDGEMEIDWRAHLHPSARPAVGTSARGSASETGLTDVEKPCPQLSRRYFSDADKRAIVAETEQPGISVSEVARRHGIVTGLLFRWRVQFGVAQKRRAQLAPVALSEGAPATLLLQDLVQPPDGMVAVDLADGRRVFAPADSNPAAVRAHVERGGAER